MKWDSRLIRDGVSKELVEHLIDEVVGEEEF